MNQKEKITKKKELNGVINVRNCGFLEIFQAMDFSHIYRTAVCKEDQ